MVSTIDVYFGRNGKKDSKPVASLSRSNAIRLEEQLKVGEGQAIFGELSVDGKKFQDAVVVRSPIGLKGLLEVYFEDDAHARVVYNKTEYTVGQTSEIPLYEQSKSYIRFEVKE